MNLKWFLAITLSLFISSIAGAREIVLLVSVISFDNLNSIAGQPQAYARWIRDEMPEKDVLEVILYQRARETGVEADRQRVEQAISALRHNLRAEDRISNIFFMSHGSSQTAPDNNTFQTLHGLGNIWNTAPDDTISPLLRTIGEYVEPNANVFLNSCDQFCGLPDQVQQRAESLMSALNIPHGQVFGADGTFIDPIMLSQHFELMPLPWFNQWFREKLRRESFQSGSANRGFLLSFRDWRVNSTTSFQLDLNGLLELMGPRICRSSFN